MNPDGITALVTGGASGLGLASARRLIREGANVVIMDLPSSHGKDVSEELGGTTIFTPGDVTSSDDVAAAVAAAEELGSLREPSIAPASVTLSGWWTSAAIRVPSRSIRRSSRSIS